MNEEKKHVHNFTRSRPGATVETCPCGNWRFTEHAGPPIVEQPARSKYAHGLTEGINCPDVKRSQLKESTRRLIKRKEKSLGRTCRKIWRATNPLGEAFTFSSFCRNRDRLIVTLEFYRPGVGWICTP
jgi:hypothetical protein